MKLTTLLSAFAAYCCSLAYGIAHGSGRPFYVIAHMANSVATMDSFLAKGANAVEIDVQFEPNGAAWWVFHGVPCDYFRVCHESTQLVDFLRAASSRNLSLLLLDLKCSKLSEEAKKFGGIDLARKLMGHFWNKGGAGINVVLSVPYLTDKPLLRSLIKEIKATDPEKMEKLSFDVSENPDFDDVNEMYRELNITATWQGDGVTNWFEPFRSFNRLRQLVRRRDRGDNVIKKVYRWTVDWKAQMRQLMQLGVDGVITNNPERCVQLVKEADSLRLARQKDSIKALYKA